MKGSLKLNAREMQTLVAVGQVLINAETGQVKYGKLSEKRLVVGEGAAPSRHAYLAFTGVYKTPLHGWCYPPFGRVVLWGRIACS
jgi:hypothetical protein